MSRKDFDVRGDTMGYKGVSRQDGTLGSKHFLDCDFFFADDDLYGSSPVPSNFRHSSTALIGDDGPPSHCSLTLALRVGIVFSRMNEM